MHVNDQELRNSAAVKEGGTMSYPSPNNGLSNECEEADIDLGLPPD